MLSIRLSLTLAAILLTALPVSAAENKSEKTRVENQLVGHWAGGVIREGAILRLELEIRRGEAGLEASRNFIDWLGYGILPPVPVAVDDDGTITIDNLYYGPAKLQLDPVYRQLVGETGDETPTASVHFVPTPPPVRPGFSEEGVSIRSGDIELAGTLVIPDGPGPHPAVVLVSGRGCSTRTQLEGFERFIARYGVAALSYDKRGAGDSEGDCATFTFEDLVDDAVAVLEYVRDDERIDASRVGLKGGSAGAWTSQGVAERALDDDDLDLPAFIITWIGPGTSIRTQQEESGVALSEEVGLTEAQTALVARALELNYAIDRPDEEVFRELETIRQQATDEGWIDRLFGDTDFAASPETIDQLWVRRFMFDPAETLARLSDTPYLAVFGLDDQVVPFASNEAALRTGLESAGNTHFEIVGIPGVSHYTEHGDRLQRVGRRAYYWKFDTVEPEFYTRSVAFLQRHGFID